MNQTRYPSKSWAFKSRLSFKVRQHGQQRLYFQCKLCWIFYKMVSAPSFSQPYLRIQPTFQSPPKNRSSTSANFHLPIPPLLYHKITLIIPTNSPFLCSSVSFHLPLFAYNHPNIYTKNIFPTSTILPI